MRFKQIGLILEFNAAHPHVQAIALYIDKFSKSLFGHDLMVTDVSRTPEEYAALYHQTPYTGPMPHLGPMSRAVDFRTIGELSDSEVHALVDHMNENWKRKDGKPTAMFHDIGSGSHLHLQSEV